VRLGYVASS